MTGPVQIVWFKRDLRVSDHRPLLEAARAGPVLPLLVIEPAYWRQPDVSARQYAFMAECAAELSQDLARRGQPLVVRVGEAVPVLEALRAALGVAALWSHEETGSAWTYARDKAVAAWAAAHSIPWREIRQDGVVRRLASRDGWARRWEARMGEPVAPPPERLRPIPDLDPGATPEPERLGPEALGLASDPCPLRQRGGRAAALETLDSFLHERGLTYRKAMSSPLEGAQACSRLSPYLAWGAVSVRETTQAARRRLRDLEGVGGAEAGAWRASLVSFLGRLHWHCHFIQKLESAPSLETRDLHPALRGLRPATPDEPLFAAWREGRTGYPFLDACVRALAASGWLNFRMRAMLVSFASYNLWLPWRETGLHLARQFTDYEPGIHWPQMQMQSGSTGINTIRVYNVVKQGHDQDPDGRFVRRWVPELARVPDSFVHEPWRWDDREALIGRAYPERIVDLAASAAAAKSRIFAARRGEAFREAADAIQERHGSRRSGMPMTGRRPRKARPVKDAQVQLELKF